MAKKKRNNIIIYFALIIFILVILNISLMSFSFEKQEEEQEEISSLIEDGEVVLVNMKIPAVDVEGNGVSTILAVQAEKGTGKTLVDIDNLLFWADTQQSIRIARLVAKDITNINLDDIDLIYSVSANASVIGGPSAGAALALATISVLEKKQLRQDVMITGSVNHDGSIGPVSAILEKAKASKNAGANIFLVPLMQSGDVVYETEQHCEEFGLSEICTIETKPRKMNVTQEAGLEVIEVGSIEEAIGYFFD